MDMTYGGRSKAIRDRRNQFVRLSCLKGRLISNAATQCPIVLRPVHRLQSISYRVFADQTKLRKLCSAFKRRWGVKSVIDF